MRKIVAATLAVPVLAIVYVAMLLRRPFGRVAAGITVTALVAVAGLATFRPADTNALPPSEPLPLPAAAFAAGVRTGHAPDEPVAIPFTVPMQPRSVEAALRVEPATAVRLSWNDARTVLTIAPARAWRTATLHTVTVEPGALDANGSPLVAPARATFLVRPATTGEISATSVAPKGLRLDSGFVVRFDHPVDLAAAAAAFRITPSVEGTFDLGGRDSRGDILSFRPARPLQPGTRYTIRLAAEVLDADGAPVAPIGALVIRTVAAPAVVRFRPVDGTKDVARSAAISVRFSQPMNRDATRKAFTATADGAQINGTVRWAEGDTVLVLDPARDLGYGQALVVTVAATATSASGVQLAAPATAHFTTEPKPTPKPASAPKPAPKPSSGGGSVGGATWLAVERYYLGLMNCTRTGGWVTSSGSCSSPGGRNVAPLRLDAGISTKVARPYAKLLAARNLCSHFVGGNPGDRLRRAGYTSYRWAENLGCRSGDPKAAVLGSHLYFQSEKSYNGGHYVNLMNAAYDRAGIGVWVSSGRVRLVVDFYHP